MRDFMRRNPRFFLLATLAAAALRLFFVFCCARITDDSRFYADIAWNWLQHGAYALTDNGLLVPTLTRLPGYPAFLAAVFAIFSTQYYTPVFLIQVGFDIATCFLIADLVRRMISDRAAKAAFLLAALCPFLANYAAAALTETLEIFCTTLALRSAVIGLADPALRIRSWLICGAAIGAAILLRPDGGILLATIVAYLSLKILQLAATGSPVRPLVKAAALTATVALLPLLPWTLRNWHTFHRVQPLAPRYANDQDERVPYGFNRWVKTWMADYASVEEIYWPVPGAELNPAKLPDRAVDSPQQRDETLSAIDDYNRDFEISSELDARFGTLASERIRAHPLRYYIYLPTLRMADMWLRPRTELLPPDVRWWEFNDDPQWSALALALGAINLLYVAAALLGSLRRPAIRFAGLLITFVVLRTLFLGTLENPEPRYTLECYPVVIVFAASLWTRNDVKRRT